MSDSSQDLLPIKDSSAHSAQLLKHQDFLHESDRPRQEATRPGCRTSAGSSTHEQPADPASLGLETEVRPGEGVPSARGRTGCGKPLFLIDGKSTYFALSEPSALNSPAVDAS